MKNKTFHLFFVLSFLILANSLQAVPQPWGIALNHETKECAGYWFGYWVGDDFRYFELPHGWTVHYPHLYSYNETTDLITIETEIGNFSIIKSEFPFGEWHIKFSNETGYSYVSQNIGIKQNIPPNKPYVFGNVTGYKNTNYSFTVIAIDPDNDPIQYIFDWGDEQMTTTEFYPSGIEVTVNHTWTSAGKYYMQVQARDHENALSSITELTILIDAINVEDIGYLTDDNADGTYDTYHSNDGAIQTMVEKIYDNEYLLDTTGDDEYNYILRYNPETEGWDIIDYEAPVEPIHEYITLFYIAVALLVIIVLLWFFLTARKKR